MREREASGGSGFNFAVLIGGCLHGAKEAVQPSKECKHSRSVEAKSNAFNVNGLTHRLTGLILEGQESMHYRL